MPATRQPETGPTFESHPPVEAVPLVDPVLPVRLLRPHGFIDDFGRHRYWGAGEVIGDPAEIQLLRQRGATIEDVC